MADVILKMDGSSGSLELEQRMAEIFAEVFALWKVKQVDYGVSNIAQMGEVGVATRANDKVQRLMHLDGKEAANEGLDDSWIDLCDYGAIGLALHRGLWPKPAPQPFAIKSRNGTAELFMNGDLVATMPTERAVTALLVLLGEMDRAALTHMLGDAG